MSLWQLAATVAGLARVSEQTTVTLSATADTVVDLEISLTTDSTALNPQNPTVISGGFHILDPTSGNPLSFGADVVRNAQHQSDFYKWQIRLVFGPQSGAPSVLVRGYAIFATYGGLV
jgi:hypothetical protein